MTDAHKDDLAAGRAGVQEDSGFVHSLLGPSRLGSTCLSSIGSGSAKPGGLAYDIPTWLGALLKGLWVQCWGKALSLGFGSVQSLRGQVGPAVWGHRSSRDPGGPCLMMGVACKNPGCKVPGVKQLAVPAYRSVWWGWRVSEVRSFQNILEVQSLSGASGKTSKSALPEGCGRCWLNRGSQYGPEWTGCHRLGLWPVLAPHVAF